MVKHTLNILRCEHRKILKVCLTILQHYEIRDHDSRLIFSNILWCLVNACDQSVCFKSVRLEILGNAKHDIIPCFKWIFRVRKTKLVFQHFVIIGFVVIVIKIMAISHHINRHWIKSLKFPMYSRDHLQISGSVVTASSMAPYILSSHQK